MSRNTIGPANAPPATVRRREDWLERGNDSRTCVVHLSVAANEATNSIILWYSVLETTLLVGLSLWQIWELMRFFGTSLTR